MMEVKQLSWKEIGKSKKIDRDLIFIKFPEACVDTCKSLHKATNAFIKGDSKAVKKYAEEVIEFEALGDEIRDTIMVMLGSVRSLPYMAIDYFTLVSEVDGVADRCEIAVRLMRTHTPPVPAEIQKKLLELSEIVIKTAELLAEACAELLDDYDAAWEKARECEQVRHKAVELHYDILEKIYKEEVRGRDLNFVVKLTRRLALIVDKAEEAADYVRLLVIKYKV